MSYLARLKALESGKIFHYAPNTEPSKPTKGAFDGFVGTPPGANENIFDDFEVNADGQNAPALVSALAETGKPWGWLLHFADRESLEVYSHPPVTHAEILTAYPDALATEPIPERPRREYTEQEDAEWAAAFSPPTSCITCTHTRRPGGVARYCSARPELPPAYGEGHPLRQLPDDGGVDCGQWRGWQ